MNSKAATLGISAAVIGGLAALVAAVAGTAGLARPAPAGSGDGAGDERGTGAGETSAPGVASGELAASAEPQPGGPAAAPTTIAAAPAAPTGDGHAVPDLAAGVDMGAGHRAPEAFRPDMDAPMTAAEREALRPAVGAPSLTGTSTSQPAGS